LNNFHFPAPSVVERYVESGAVLLRTDLDGAVTVDASPDQMTVQTVRTRSAPIKIMPPAR
jgi:beta-lactamase superfamily II metal-dependent hydrolase